MVPSAQVAEIVDLRLPALGMVEGVVDLASMHRHPASRESTVLVARPQESSHRFGGRVAVGLDDQSGGIEEETRPPAVATREVTDDVGVHGAVAVELGGSVVATRKRRGGDRDLDARDDVVEAATVRGTRVRGEQKVDQEVGAHLIDRPVVGGDVLDIGAVDRVGQRILHRVYRASGPS